MEGTRSAEAAERTPPGQGCEIRGRCSVCRPRAAATRKQVDSAAVGQGWHPAGGEGVALRFWLEALACGAHPSEEGHEDPQSKTRMSCCPPLGNPGTQPAHSDVAIIARTLANCEPRCGAVCAQPFPSSLYAAGTFVAGAPPAAERPRQSCQSSQLSLTNQCADTRDGCNCPFAHRDRRSGASHRCPGNSHAAILGSAGGRITFPGWVRYKVANSIAYAATRRASLCRHGRGRR